MVKLIRKMGIIAILLPILACSPVSTEQPSEVFEGLSEVTPGLSTVDKAIPIVFPDDHASHPDFAIEWWYLTANLQDDAGKQYALQWTLFRFNNGAMVTPWSSEQQFMGHAKLRSDNHHWFEERFARGEVGNAGVKTPPFNAYIDDWHWQAEGADLFPARLHFTLQNDVEAELTLNSPASYVLHGDNGVSIKLRDGSQASYYYSQPFIALQGTLSMPNQTVNVQGQGWFDHEWTSQYLTSTTSGWDWFSLHLENGDKVMLFNMRHENQPDFWSGSYITEQGVRSALAEQDIVAKVTQFKEVQGRRLPLSWQIALPVQQLDLTVQTLWDDQYNPGLLSYYEGAVAVSGSVAGIGFMELTGYPRIR